MGTNGEVVVIVVNVLHTEKEEYMQLYYRGNKQGFFIESNIEVENVKYDVQQIKTGVLYRHYKGDTYRVLFKGVLDVVENEKVVVYRREKDRLLFARPQEMFYEQVEVNGERQDRFKRIEE